MSFTSQDIDHLSRLAGIRLTAGEKEKFSSQLSSVLEYVKKIQDIDTSGDHVDFHLEKFHDVTEKDQVRPYGDAEKMIEAAPEVRDRLIRVPPVKDAS